MPFLPPNQQRQSTEGTHNIAQAFKNNRGRLPERHEYLSMLAVFEQQRVDMSALLHAAARTSAAADGPRDALNIRCLSKSCQLLHICRNKLYKNSTAPSVPSHGAVTVVSVVS